MTDAIETDPRIDAVLHVLEGIRSLPTLPAVALEVIALARNPRTSMKQIEEVVTTDPALATKILKVANSPFYGIRREISSLRLALVVLGMRQVRSLVIGIGVLKALSGGKSGLFDHAALWEHCAGTGALCRMLARRFGLEFDGEEYVAGLTHDIGKLTLYQYMNKEFAQALSEAAERHEPLEAAEQRIMGVDHAFVGWWLADRWGLPDSLVEAIRDHHNPPAESRGTLAAVVNLADAIARISGIGNSANPVTPDLATLKGWQMLGRAADGVSPEEFLGQMGGDIESARGFAQIF
jgi:putative nucleotidyltransferase with HDIG domain